MSELICCAGEDAKTGDLLALEDGVKIVRYRADEHDSAIGVAATNLIRGQDVSYNPLSNTTDILLSARADLND